MALNSRFCDSQPTLLKASVMAPAVSPLSAAVSTVASMSELLRPATAILPSVAVSELFLTVASTALCTRLVTAWPPPPTTVPVPQALPPEALTLTSACAASCESARADTPILPALLVSVAASTLAATLLRTSLSTTSAP